MFAVEMKDIPSFVSTHLVRHKIGVEHFVQSNRADRGGNAHADRNTLINHLMVLNAQALITMARKRLCSKASLETQEIMATIANKIHEVDAALAMCMLPECEYRGGCTEMNSCGYMARK